MSLCDNFENKSAMNEYDTADNQHVPMLQMEVTVDIEKDYSCRINTYIIMP